MEIERMVYECSKVGIEKGYSGGQIYSYTRGMKELLADTKLNLSRLADYKEPVDLEADPEKNIAPMFFTYKQLDTLFPRQFRFKPYIYGSRKLFAFSNNKMSVDWDLYADYDEYLNARRDGDKIVGGRSGCHEFYILTGEEERLENFPCMYYQSESLRVPYTERDFCSSEKPDYMSALSTIFVGETITKERIREFLEEEAERNEILKRMVYCLLRYKKSENCSYDKNLIICDDHEIIIYWISALSFLFSEDMAKELSFSTYEYSPVGSDYRICGAFPRGTDYSAGASYRECYVFDFCNQKYEEVGNMRDREFYGFLVNSFLYAPEALDRFYDFVSNFDFSEVSVELENAFELYCFLYMNTEKKSISSEQFKMAASFAKYCKKNTMIREILVKFINSYMTMTPQEMQENEQSVIWILRCFSAQMTFLETVCTEKLVHMLMPSSRMPIETIHIIFERHISLFGKAGSKLILVFFEILQRRVDEVLIHNSNLDYNIYIAQIISRYMRDNKVKITQISPDYGEGKLLYIIVENILMQNLPTEKLKRYIMRMTDFYLENAYEYLYFVMELERMACDYKEDCVQEWIRASEACIDTYIDSKDRGSVLEIYRALIELECEDKVLNHIERRSRTNETFDLLFDDVCVLLKDYTKYFEKRKSRIYQVLLTAAEKKDHPQDNLIKFFQMRLGTEDDGLFIKAADKIVEYMDMQASSVDIMLLDSLAELYKQNCIRINSKLVAIKILKEMENDLKKGKKHIILKYGRQPSGAKQFEFPKVTDAMKGKFFDEYSLRVIEIYNLCENIYIVFYFNHLFKISELETMALMQIELENMVREYRRADVELFCRLLAYAFLSGGQPESHTMAKILNAGKININKVNKCLNEKNEELLEDLHDKIKFRASSGYESAKLLAYWDEVFCMAKEGGSNLMKKVMKTFLKIKK